MTGLYRELIAHLATRVDRPKPYHVETPFLWQLDLDEDGVPTTPALTPLTTSKGDGERIRVIPGMWHWVPRVSRTSGDRPMLASDDVAYVLGWADESMRADKVARRHALFVELTRKWTESDVARDDPVPRALLRFLTEHTGQIVRPDEWTSKDGVLVSIGGRYAHESASVIPFWTGYAGDSKAASAAGLCLVCGRHGPVVDTLPLNVKGKFAPGGQSSGVAPISINEAPYGFDLKRGLGRVPICASCGLAIPEALNLLLGDAQRVHTSDTARTTWWSTGRSGEFDPYGEVQQPDERSVAALFASVQSGRDIVDRVDLDEFHSLTVSGNAARLVIRDWWHVPVRTVKANLARWFADIDLGAGTYPALWRLAVSTGRYDADKKKYLALGSPGGRHPHGITETLFDVALKGAPLPGSVLAHLIQRVTADGHVADDRVGLLRLAVNRSHRTQETVMPGLDTENTHPCYVLGQLLAVYESLQYNAATADGGKEPNATFADKYLAGAISSPGLVIATGERQAAAWLGKLKRTGRDDFFRRDIDAIVALLDPHRPPPSRASLDEQALFVMGYHHQRLHTFRQIEQAKQRRAEAADAGRSTAATSPEQR